MKHYVRSFYKFISIPSEQIERLKSQFENLALQNQTQGLIVLGVEGINSTVSASTEKNIEKFLVQLQALPEIGTFETKRSISDKPPFRRFKVAVRDEIVTLGTPNLVPDGRHNHLPPKDWESTLNDPDVVVIDTRNWYETQVGKFKNAVDLNINEFREFPEAVKKLNLPKEQKVLMYCTGGIRCEKAILEMNRQGYENVFQLEGGILKYLEQFPNKSWEGECFVFDHRVAVDQYLNPSTQYGLCPHCGQPSDKKILCIRCDAEATPCKSCVEKSIEYSTCSKNCAHHYKVRPGKGRRQLLESGSRRSLKS